MSVLTATGRSSILLTCNLIVFFSILNIPSSDSFSLSTSTGKTMNDPLSSKSMFSSAQFHFHSSLALVQSTFQSKLYATPPDDKFYDGYDVFIQGLQADLENDSFDIYDDEQDTTSTSNQEEAQQTEAHPQHQQQQQQQRRRPPNHKKGPQTQQRSKRRKPGYRRDPTDDMAIPINEAEISNLISLRSKAQKERNYVKADDILHDLNNVHGVYVWDKDGLWSVSPIAPSRRYKNYAAGGARDVTGNNQGNTNGNGRKSTQFGRNGHDYTQIGDDIDETVCSLQLHEIHSLIAKRLGHKLMRDYDKADEIQTTLYKNGVKIHDKLRQWRADGGIFADMDGIASGNLFQINSHSAPVEGEDILDEIKEVVAVRDEARARSDYAEADRLREVLWDKFRVGVDDKSRTFSLGGDFGPDGTFRWTDNGPINPRKGRNPLLSRDWRVVGGMYAKSEFSEPLESKDEEEVNNLIHDRLEAKRVRDFEVSDLIANHLYNAYRISVDDQLRQWSVGGQFDESAIKLLRKNSPTSADGKSTSSYVRRYNRRGGAGHLSEREIQMVEAMVQRRSEEMARYNRQAAESILQGLRKKYFVIVDDMNDEWHIRGNDFILSPDLEGNLPKYVEESRAEIEKRIRERSQAKGEKDFVRADEIRSDLLQTYNIKLDDRIKEWTIIGNSDRNGILPDEDEFSPSPFEENEFTLSKLTVVELKEKLKDRGLPRTGKKADLLQRILDNH